MDIQSAPQASPHYISNDNSRLLRSLHEFVCAGGGMMLVSGPHGSGKSELLEQFVQNAGQSWQICRTSAMANPDGAVLLARIARCFDVRLMDASGKDPATQLSVRLASSQHSLIPVIVIDDAERLSDESLALLTRLLSHSQSVSRDPRIVLFGDSLLAERLAHASINLQRLELLPLDLFGISDYLRYRLQRSGHSGTFPFSMRQLRRIEKESGGWPGRIDSVAHEIITIEGPKGQHRHRVAITVLLVMMTLIVLYFFVTRDDYQPVISASQPAVASTVQQGDAAAEPQATTIYLAEANETDESPVVQSSAEAVNTTPFDESVIREGTAEPTQGSVSEQSEVPANVVYATGRVEGAEWIAKQPPAHYTLQVMVASTPGGIIDLAQRAGDTEGPKAVAGFRQDGRLLYLLLQGSYASRSTAEDAAAGVEAVYKVRPWIRRFDALPELFEVPSQPAVPPSTPGNSSDSAVAGAAWLWSRNPARYTIQLLSDGRKSTLHEYINAHRPAMPLAVVRVDRDGKAWYLLLAGEYGDATEAASAIAKLPATMRGATPWPRTFAAVQDEMVASKR